MLSAIFVFTAHAHIDRTAATPARAEKLAKAAFAVALISLVERDICFILR